MHIFIVFFLVIMSGSPVLGIIQDDEQTQTLGENNGILSADDDNQTVARIPDQKVPDNQVGNGGFFKKLWRRWRGKKTEGVVKKETSAKKSNPVDEERHTYQWIKTYGEVLGMVKKRGWRHADVEKFVQDSLKFGISRVDAHSAFFAPDSFLAAKESASGEFPGVGISIIGKTLDDDVLVIVDVVEGGPAFKAGMKSGDKITEVDGFKLKGLSSDEVINKLKGKVNTTVVVKYLRNKKPCETTLTRDIIKDQQSFAYYFKEQKVYYVSLRLFADNTADQVSDLLKKANAGECRGIVLDLRRNPGGVLDSAIDMAGLFLAKKSLVVSTKKSDGRVVSEYYTSVDPLLKMDIPVVVLIDNFTASAAEILAGVLQHYSQKSYEKEKGAAHKVMVFLVGTGTFGKGSVQEVIPISNGCALKLTTMLYYLPGDVSIQAVGIQPDFVVKPKFIPTEEMKWVLDMYGKETSFKGHITTGEVKGVGKEPAEQPKASAQDKSDSEEGEEKKPNGDEPEKNWEERHKEAITGDNQIQAAVNIINLLSFAREHAPRLIKTREKALEFLKKHYISDDLKEIEKIR